MSRDVTTLGELISLQRGYDLPETQRHPGNVPVVGSAGITGYHSTAKAKGPGVTVGRSGASFGKVTFVREDYWPHNAALFVTDFKGNEPLFIRYLLESLDFSSLNSGSAQQSLNRNYVYTVLVGKFDLRIQRRIAGILTAYDDLIENNQRRIKILEEMARSLYREWFVHFRFPGHDKVKMVSSPLGPIPQGWEIAPLGDLVQFKSGFAFKSGTFSADGEYRLVTIRNVQDGSFNPECDSRTSERPDNLPPHCILEDGDILLSLTGNVGRVCLVYDGPFFLNQRVAKLAPTNSIDWTLTYCIFRETAMRVKLEQLSTGVAQQNLSPVLASKLEIAMPPVDLRQRFSAFADVLITRVVQLNSTISNLRRTRDLLLPRLLSGQINVTFRESVA